VLFVLSLVLLLLQGKNFNSISLVFGTVEQISSLGILVKQATFEEMVDVKI
jgi:uncharacterized membrane protein affecting hemolysin expression